MRATWNRLLPLSILVVIAMSLSTAAQANLQKNLLIYYGWPSGFNSHIVQANWNTAISNPLVAADLARYDLVILADGLEDPNHGDHANTIAIVNMARALNPALKIFGYIDIGNTFAHPVPVMETSAMQWSSLIRVDGILLDEFGFDYATGVWSNSFYRVNRQNHMVSFVHNLINVSTGQPLEVMANAWNPDDIFVLEPANPTTLGLGDAVLDESFCYAASGSGKSLRPWSNTFGTGTFDKAQKFAAAIVAHGVQVWAVSTTYSLNASFQQFRLDLMAAMGQAFQYTGIGWGNDDFAAVNNNVPYRAPSDSLRKMFAVTAPSIDFMAQQLKYGHADGGVFIDYANEVVVEF